MFYWKYFSLVFIPFDVQTAKKAGMEKVLYYSRMTKIFIIKSLSDLYNKEISPVSSSSSFKVWISSDSETEEEESIDHDDPESIDEDMLEILSP